MVRLKQRLTAAGSAEASGTSLATKAGGGGVSSLAQFQQRLDALLIRTLDDYEQLHDLRRQVGLRQHNYNDSQTCSAISASHCVVF